MSFSESFVARPRRRMRRPVALGSRVPQWPTFLMRNWRRTFSTMSWEVGPAGLSIRRAPSKGSKGCMGDGRRDAGCGMREGKSEIRHPKRIGKLKQEYAANGDLLSVAYFHFSAF